MADDGILGLLGRLNDPAALYGGALTDPATRQAMAGRGLLAMAGSFADSAMPTRMPTPFGAVLGHAASAAGSSEDTIMESRLRNAQAQQAMANVGVLNQIGPAYDLWMKEQLRLSALAAGGAPGSGIPQAPPPGTVGPGGPAPTGPINPDLVTWEAKNQGINPLIAHTTADIESSYGANTGNKVSPSNTGVFQRAKADAPGGQNDTFPNQIKLGVSDLVTARDELRASLGREPTNAEVYLAHQQGVSGATKLISNPNTPAGELVPPVNISNNAGNPKAPASTFVAHWADAYNKREAKFAPGTLTPPGAGIAAGPPTPPGAQVGGLLNLPPGIADRMNAPIPGIPDVAPGAAAAAAATPRSAGEALVAMNQATQAAGGLPALSPNLPRVADASGKVVPVPPAPAAPAAPVPPTLVPGGKAIQGLLGGGAAPPGPPPQVATAPPPGQPQSLIPQPPAAAPVPPIAQPQVPQAPAPAPMAGPPAGAPPPLNLPAPPSMPAGMGAPPATPLQIISQGIAGLSSLTGHPAPDFMQKLANQPVEMQMEAYKAYVQAQANQLTEKYKKEIEVASAQALEYYKTQGALPADLTKMTVQQKLDLDTKMRVLGFLPDEKGNYTKIDPLYLEKRAREAGATAGATAAATNAANLASTYPMGGGPPPAVQPNEPAKGTPSPYGMLPPLSEEKLPRSAKEAEAAPALWNARVDTWTNGIQPAQTAELRLMTIAQAFKSIQTGKWAEQKADLVTALDSIGIHLDRTKINDPAQVQIALHENILTTLPLLKAATPRPSQVEFVTTKESREGPNLQPEANLQMLAEDIALVRQAQNLPAAFHASGWQNAQQFETAFLGRNKLAPMAEDIKKEIGKLGGMEGWVPPGMPEGTKPGEGLIQGKPYYVLPDGSRRWGP